jgi:adenylosuccinate synthase
VCSYIEVKVADFVSFRETVAETSFLKLFAETGHFYQGPGQHLATVGAEYGTTTGRPRRTGWLDIPQMQFAVVINCFNSLNLTKIDVLTGLSEVKIAEAYKYNGEYLTTMPASPTVLSNVQVEYETLQGWTEDMSGCRSFEELPAACQTYILRVQELIGVPVRWIGAGPNRADVIDRVKGWDMAAPVVSND